MAYLILSLLITATLGVVFVWWGNASDLFLFELYGYNIDGMNDTEFFGRVSPENLDRVNELVISVMGISWQLKAIMMLIFCLPYTILVYFLNHLIRKRIL